MEKSYLNKQTLIVISIDFAKAFDSVKRDVMIKLLMEYNINEKAIETVTKMYTGDVTNIRLDNAEMLKVPVSSGIRQGCTGSTTLFKLVTFKIMQKLENLNKGYRDENFNVTSLFFGDDGMLLASSVKDAEEVIEQVLSTGRECGLEMNKEKSKIIVFNMKEKP